MNIVFLIITYEPDREEFLKNLSINKSASSKIIIVDNSYLEDSISLVKSVESENVVVIQNKYNSGIATAQNIGIRVFLESGEEYLLQLDQDSSITHIGLQKLFNCFTKLNKTVKIAAVGPTAINHKERKVRELKSSGMLTNRDVIINVGLMNSKLFIDLVDYEWSWRANKLMYSLYEVPCDFEHQLGGNYKIFGLIDISIPTPIRHYYQTRNSLTLIFSNQAPFSWSLARLLIILIKFIIYPIILPNGLIRLKFMAIGVKDFLYGRMGKYNNIKSPS